MSRQSTLALLRDLQRLLAPPGAWHQGHTRAVAAGRLAVLPTDPRAVAWSFAGAIERVARQALSADLEEPAWDQIILAEDALITALDFAHRSEVVEWDRTWGRSQADLAARIAAAIQRQAHPILAALGFFG